jgi:hypothetical protein
VFGPGDFWGEGALLSDQLASVTVVTLTPTTLFAFDRRSFLGLLGELPMVSMALLKAMAGWEPPYAQHGGEHVPPLLALDQPGSPRSVAPLAWSQADGNPGGGRLGSVISTRASRSGPTPSER